MEVLVADREYLDLALLVKRHLEGKPAAYGVYFKDLTTGGNFGINARFPFVQASCVKVAYVLFCYERVVAGEYGLHDRISYQPETDYSPGSGYLQYVLRAGDRLTLRTLAKVAICLSDNIAYRMLKRVLGPERVVNYMRLLGGENPNPNGEQETTPRDLAAYLEGVLDFARRHPELGKLLLDDLAHPVWHSGLPGLLPDEVEVAHKEGDLPGVANDAGIVFFPGHPYILVVLSRGQPEVAEGFREIAVISRLVYDFHSSLWGTPEKS